MILDELTFDLSLKRQYSYAYLPLISTAIWQSGRVKCLAHNMSNIPRIISISGQRGNRPNLPCMQLKTEAILVSLVVQQIRHQQACLSVRPVRHHISMSAPMIHGGLRSVALPLNRSASISDPWDRQRARFSTESSKCVTR